MAKYFDFPAELDATFKLMALTRERLQKEMLDKKVGDTFHATHLAALEKLAVAQAKLGTEIRQWAGHQKSSLDKMPAAKKAEVVIQFIQSELTVSARRDLYTVLAKHESERADGLRLTITDPFGSTPARDVDSDDPE